MWRAIRRVFGGGGSDATATNEQAQRQTLDGRNSDWFDARALPPFGFPQPPSSADSLSIASNPSVSSYNSSTRQRHHKYIAMQYFGPNSQTQFDPEDDEYFEAGSNTSNSNNVSVAEASTGSLYEELLLVPEEETTTAAKTTPKVKRRLDETPAQRHARKQNQRAFDTLVHLANTKQPVTLDAFKRPAPTSPSGPSENDKHDVRDDEQDDEDEDDDFTPLTRTTQLRAQLNTELIEAYVAYAHSIGHEPEIRVAVTDPLSDDDDVDPLHQQHGDDEEEEKEELAAERLSFVHVRKRLLEHTHWATRWIGTRYSRRRGCVQFWSFLGVGVLVTVVMILFLAHVKLNEVLHLDAFVGDDVVLTSDFAFMHLRDEVGFRLRYEIHSADATDNNHTFRVLLLTEDDFEDYVDGEPFSFIAEGSWLQATTHASLPLTRIANTDHDEMYLVVQPCRLSRFAASPLDFCETRSLAPQQQQLPARVSSSQKLFALPSQHETTASSSSSPSQPLSGLVIRSFYVNPMPDDCAASGWKGVSFLFIFVPYVLAAALGLRVLQMALRCESFRTNLERNYNHEFEIPEAEVDYWQPSPWDRKVPKTRLLGPCCWRKMRRPTEPFYTWWRHENYFTWIFFPYRNERLSRGERGIIIFCSLYITFYVTFVLAMLHGALGEQLPIVGSVVVYWLTLMVLPSLGKAVFKEIFKLIFRQRRKYFRLKARGGDTSAFSFRVAFLLQVLVVLFISLAQGPMLYIWLYRSCTFLSEFLYFGVLAALARLSLFGLVQDFVWYSVIRTWGWRDLCPHCTERLVHCDCFNDELLVLAVERVGAKWELILILDKVLSRYAGHEPQFHGLYSAQQLHERWLVLVERAQSHMDTVEKLTAYRLKKQREAQLKAQAQQLGRRSLLSRRMSRFVAEEQATEEPNDEEEELKKEEPLAAVDSSRERKILALNQLIHLDSFEKHYDSSIVDVFRTLRRTVKSTMHQQSDATPAQRLARNEDERELRAQAFRVLGGYRIEKTRAAPVADTVPESGEKEMKKTQSFMLAPWRSLGAALDHTRELLLPSAAARTTSETAEIQSEDVVVVVDEESMETDVGNASCSPSTSQQQPQQHVYHVTEREPTLWEQSVGHLGGIVGWAFKYDSTQY